MTLTSNPLLLLGFSPVGVKVLFVVVEALLADDDDDASVNSGGGKNRTQLMV